MYEPQIVLCAKLKIHLERTTLSSLCCGNQLLSISPSCYNDQVNILLLSLWENHKPLKYLRFCISQPGLMSFPLCFLWFTGLSLTAMWTCVAHTGYFILCAVLLTFLRCPGFSRAALLLTVPLNAVAEVNQQPALDLSSLSLLLLTLSLGTNLKLLTSQTQHRLIRSALSCLCHNIFCVCLFCLMMSTAHWFVNQLWACVQVKGKPAAPLLLASCDIVESQKPVSSCQSYPPSSTPQKWVCRPQCIQTMLQKPKQGWRISVVVTAENLLQLGQVPRKRDLILFVCLDSEIFVT